MASRAHAEGRALSKTVLAATTRGGSFSEVSRWQSRSTLHQDNWISIVLAESKQSALRSFVLTQLKSFLQQAHLVVMYHWFHQ